MAEYLMEKYVRLRGVGHGQSTVHSWHNNESMDFSDQRCRITRGFWVDGIQAILSVLIGYSSGFGQVFVRLPSPCALSAPDFIIDDPKYLGNCRVATHYTFHELLLVSL
jgi:hypothetical protein